jgi:CheY-like chemotaxis protein
VAVHNVLVIDDDPNILKLLKELLSGKPQYNLLVAADGKTAARCFAENKVDVVLTDIHMPGFTGIELMADMQKINFKPEILVMTANATPENVEKARAIGARSLVLKPFDNLDVVEEEIQKAVRAAAEAAAEKGGGQAKAAPQAAAPAPTPAPAAAAAPPQAPAAAPAAPAASAPAAAPAAPTPTGAAAPTPPAATPPAPRATPKAPPAAQAPAAASAPAAAPVAAAAPSPAAAPPPGATVRMDMPEIDSWKDSLVGNQTPDPGGSVARAGGAELADQMEGGAPPASAPGSGEGAASKTMAARAEAARASALGKVPAPPATTPAAPSAPAVSPAESTPSTAPAPAVHNEAHAESILDIPSDLESVFRATADLDAGKMKMQVPIVCLQTWEEQGAIATLRVLAGELKRDFHVWSAARGIVRAEGQEMGEMYRNPNRALEFIRRQKNNGLYILADFRQCLEDRTVVRTLREMVMEGETVKAFLVLTDPRMAIPPELQPACVSFDWPASDGADLTALYEEVMAEVSASTGKAIRLDQSAREKLLNSVKEMPAGRARFEIARVLMTRKGRKA